MIESSYMLDGSSQVVLANLLSRVMVSFVNWEPSSWTPSMELPFLWVTLNTLLIMISPKKLPFKSPHTYFSNWEVS